MVVLHGGCSGVVWTLYIMYIYITGLSGLHHWSGNCDVYVDLCVFAGSLVGTPDVMS